MSVLFTAVNRTSFQYEIDVAVSRAGPEGLDTLRTILDKLVFPFNLSQQAEITAVDITTGEASQVKSRTHRIVMHNKCNHKDHILLSIL